MKYFLYKPNDLNLIPRTCIKVVGERTSSTKLSPDHYMCAMHMYTDVYIIPTYNDNKSKQNQETR